MAEESQPRGRPEEIRPHTWEKEKNFPVNKAEAEVIISLINLSDAEEWGEGSQKILERLWYRLEDEVFADPNMGPLGESWTFGPYKEQCEKCGDRGPVRSGLALEEDLERGWFCRECTLGIGDSPSFDEVIEQASSNSLQFHFDWLKMEYGRE